MKTIEERKAELATLGQEPFTRPGKPPYHGIQPVVVPEDALMEMPDDQFDALMEVWKLRKEQIERHDSLAAADKALLESSMSILTHSRVSIANRMAAATTSGVVTHGIKMVLDQLDDSISKVKGMMVKDK